MCGKATELNYNFKHCFDLFSPPAPSSSPSQWFSNITPPLPSHLLLYSHLSILKLKSIPFSLGVARDEASGTATTGAYTIVTQVLCIKPSTGTEMYMNIASNHWLIWKLQYIMYKVVNLLSIPNVSISKPDWIMARATAALPPDAKRQTVGCLW